MKYRPSPPLRLLRRLFRSIDNHGIRGAVLHSCRRMAHSLSEYGLSGTFERAFIKAPEWPQAAVTWAPHPFDLLYGTDTGGNYSAADLSAVSLSALYATGYRGVPTSTLKPALATLPIQHEKFSFVDIGCGKGRALLIAAEFPFRRLCGVEIASELCQVARANLALKPEWEQRIAIAEQDATTYLYPEGPLVVYLYNPFYAALLRRVLANLERQLRRSPRPTYILYGDVYSTTDLDKVMAGESRFESAMNPLSSMRILSDRAYPLSAEEAAAEPLGATANRFTLLSFDV